MPLPGRGGDHCRELVEERQETSPLLSQHRDTLLNAEKHYITSQQDKTTSKARFYLQSSCAKTLLSPTDTV